MKTIELSKELIRICSKEEFLKNARKLELAPSVDEQLEGMQMLHLTNTEGKNTFLIIELNDKNTLVSNIMRVLNAYQLNEAVGAAEDGNILSDEETDHMAFDFAADLYKLLKALG